MTEWAHRQLRIEAARIAATAFAHEPEGSRTGTRLLSFIILLERYLLDGGDAAAEAMGWDIKERDPVLLTEVKEAMARGEWPGVEEDA
jgi:hypothetical protein